MAVIISAAEFEVASIWEQCKPGQFEFLSCGIGPLNAARNEYRLQELCKGKDVIFVGSCGTLGTFTGIELVTVKKALWLPVCVRTGMSWPAKDGEESIDLTPSILCKDLPVKVLIQSPTIGKSSEVRPEMRAHFDLPPNEDLIENMEFYNCASLKNYARSFSVVLAVTNALNEEGRTFWKKNFKAAAEKTADFLCAH